MLGDYRMKTKSVAPGLLLLFTAVSLWGAEDARATEPASGAVTAAEVPGMPAVAGAGEAAGPEGGPVRLSLDYPDVEIRELLRDVAERFDLNLVIPDTLRGRTSLKLRDVTWEQILKVVLTPIGWAHEIDGDIVKIVRRAPDAGEGDSGSAAGDGASRWDGEEDALFGAVARMQADAAKALLRDADFADATAEFYWNLYQALLRKGFTKEQAMRLVVASASVAAPGGE